MKGWRLPSRRDLLVAAAGLPILSACAAFGHTARIQGRTSSADLALEAALFSIAPVEFARQAWRNQQRGGPNKINHRQNLSGAADRNVTTPNRDTLYSAAILDLSAAPVVISVPASPDRYLSVSIHSAFTDVEALISARETAFGAVALTVCGPGWEGQPAHGTRLARLSTNDAWLIARVLAASEEDLASARSLQQAITLSPFPGLDFSPVRRWMVEPAPDIDPANRLDVVNELLSRSPPEPRWSRWAGFGIGSALPGAFTRLPADFQVAWADAVGVAEKAVVNGLAVRSRSLAGWTVPAPGLARFGSDELYRAAVSRSGLGALPLSEASYLSWRQDDPVGKASRFELTVPASPPADAFWSLSLYVPEADGRLFFFANPLNRHAIGDRTPSVIREPDGSTRIDLSSEPAAKTNNWLPAPDGAFELVLRLYLPRDLAARGEWAPGPVRQVV